VDIFRKVDTMSRMSDTRKARRPRRQFTDDFKREAVRLVLDEGKTIGATARDLDLTSGSAPGRRPNFNARLAIIEL
jgi:transposase-like protein